MRQQIIPTYCHSMKMGSVERDKPGTVCAPNGSVIAGARVVAETRTCRGEAKLVETAADIRGSFRLEGLAPGPVNLTITSGSFVGRYSVDIVAGREVRWLQEPALRSVYLLRTASWRIDWGLR